MPAFSMSIMEGRYTDGFLEYAGNDAPKFTDDELKIISSPVDFLGLNIYAPQHYMVPPTRAPGFDAAAVPELLSAHEFGLAQDRPGDRLLGAAACGKCLE